MLLTAYLSVGVLIGLTGLGVCVRDGDLPAVPTWRLVTAVFLVGVLWLPVLLHVVIQDQHRR